jgi:hypothetical protein
MRPAAPVKDDGIKIRFISGDMPSGVQSDFMAAARKAFRATVKLNEIADAIRERMVVLRGVGWIVVLGRDIWRTLRYKRLTHGELLVTRQGKPDINVMACKCADDVGSAPVAAQGQAASVKPCVLGLLCGDLWTV